MHTMHTRVHINKIINNFISIYCNLPISATSSNNKSIFVSSICFFLTSGGTACRSTYPMGDLRLAPGLRIPSGIVRMSSNKECLLGQWTFPLPALFLASVLLQPDCWALLCRFVNGLGQLSLFASADGFAFFLADACLRLTSSFLSFCC